MKKNIAIFFLNVFLIACFFFIIRQTSEYKESKSFKTDNTFAVVNFDKLSQPGEETKFQSYTAHKASLVKTFAARHKANMSKNLFNNNGQSDAVFATNPEDINNQKDKNGAIKKFTKNTDSKYRYSYFSQTKEEEFSKNLGRSADGFLAYSSSINVSGSGNSVFNLSQTLANNNVTNPKLTLDNNLDDEDPLDPGNGIDNDSFYNDVPIGDGTIFMLLLTLVFVVWKRRGIIHNS